MWKEWRDYAQKDEAHWQNHLEKGLLKAEHVRDYVLQLWFEEELDVSIYELDFYPLVVSENPLNGKSRTLPPNIKLYYSII